MACFSAKGDNSTFMVNSKLHLQANLFPRIKELICLETIISGGGGLYLEFSRYVKLCCF